MEQLRARFSDRLEAELSMIQTVHSSAFPCSLSETLCPSLDSQPKPCVLYGLCQVRLPLLLRGISDTQEGEALPAHDHLDPTVTVEPDLL